MREREGEIEASEKVCKVRSVRVRNEWVRKNERELFYSKLIYKPSYVKR